MANMRLRNLVVFASIVSASVPAAQEPATGCQDYAAADIRVIAPGGIYNAGLMDLASAYTKQTGKKIGVSLVGMGRIVNAVTTSIPPADVIMLPFELMSPLSLDGGVAPGTFSPLGRSETGLAVRAGAPHPAISTVAKLASVMRSAKAVMRSNPAGGSMVAKVIEDKVIHRPEFAGVSFSQGAAPRGWNRISEISAKSGIERRVESKRACALPVALATTCPRSAPRRPENGAAAARTSPAACGSAAGKHLSALRLRSWVQHWRKHQAAGDVIVVRYADDIVVGFEKRADTERFLQEWKERLQKFGLQLHPDKTHLIEFGRHAAENRKQRGEGKSEVFNFLGRTFVGRLGRPAGSSSSERRSGSDSLPSSHLDTALLVHYL